MKFAASLLALAVVTGASAGDRIPGRYIVGWKPGMSETGRLAPTRVAWLETIFLASINASVVVSPSEPNVFLREMEANPAVSFAEPDYVTHMAYVPNDEKLNSQTALGIIEASAAWDFSRGTEIRIGILDTGIQMNHPDLAEKIVAAKGFAFRGQSPEDTFGHGTHVAGIAAARTDNSLGVAGVGFDAKLVIANVFDANGEASYSSLVSAMDWCMDRGAKVLNMSLGGSDGSKAMEIALENAYLRRVTVVAAAGNQNRRRAFYPAYYRRCIAVAATDKNDKRASFSNYGDWVDVAAPGVNIVSTYPTSTYAWSNGTSMASPHVAGLAALLWASSWGVNQASVRSRIENLGDLVTVGFGPNPLMRINARRSLSAELP